MKVPNPKVLREREIVASCCMEQAILNATNILVQAVSTHSELALTSKGREISKEVQRNLHELSTEIK